MTGVEDVSASLGVFTDIHPGNMENPQLPTFSGPWAARSMEVEKFYKKCRRMGFRDPRLPMVHVD
jgi:hypothetical protein